MEKWEELIAEKGSRVDCAICLLSNAPKQMADLVNMAKRAFGERCIVDPDDDSTETKVLLTDDLDRTMARRGNKGEWHPYEMWTSNNARRWTEGLKKELRSLGLSYNPEHLHLVTCGQQWGGCLTKYSMFMAKYLGLTAAPDLRAELSPDAGFPFKAVFTERIEMARHVYLFLFRMADGRPMGQYIDGLRAIWEPPHMATVQLDPSKVEIFNLPPNAYLQASGSATLTDTGIIADVCDGCHPAKTTIVGTALEYDEFRSFLTDAVITAKNGRRSVQYISGYLDPMTMSRGDE